MRLLENPSAEQPFGWESSRFTAKAQRSAKVFGVGHYPLNLDQADRRYRNAMPSKERMSTSWRASRCDAGWDPPGTRKPAPFFAALCVLRAFAVKQKPAAPQGAAGFEIRLVSKRD